MRDGTPLPSTLTGNISERVIQLDDALFYLVGGYLAKLVQFEPLEQTGTLTEVDARDALSAMLEVFYDGRVSIVPIGATMMWWDATPPEKWLLMNGSGYSKTTYPELFDIFGYGYGGSGDTFVIPTMASFSPMGVGGYIALGQTKGNTQVNLSVAQLPAHDHPVTDPGHTHSPAAGTTVFVGRTAGGATDWVRATAGATFRQDAATASNTTGVTVGNRGDGGAVDIVHPVRGVYFIIYAGR